MELAALLIDTAANAPKPAPPEWVGIVKDFAIPAASILIPSAIAVWLARSERNAARKQRADERLSRGIEEAYAAVSDLTEAAYTPSFQEAARIRIRAASRVERIEYGLGPDNDAVFDWITDELAVMARGLEDTSDLGLPVLMEQVVWRGANIGTVLARWRGGKIDLEWFRAADHPALEDTVSPEVADAADKA